MSEIFILVPGRSSQQGCGINEGKFGETYQAATSFVQMNPDDMQRLTIEDEQLIELKSEFGEIQLPARKAKPDELPSGLLFMAYGDLSSQLMGGDTHGSGMPTSKGIDVQLKKVL
ncbi:MAG: molybdopterin dinucleotide binding domain-containing protein [Planctomycetota bacterium]|nr:molybdopterin dinucleotide binding domain-containing protein [Planctomycetota bacterium]